MTEFPCLTKWGSATTRWQSYHDSVGCGKVNEDILMLPFPNH